MKSPWHPLLAGDLAGAARQAVAALAAELPGAAPEVPLELPAALGPVGRAALATGDPGLALFYAYLALDREDDRFAGRALTHLDRATDSVADLPLDDSLYRGFPGIGWVAEHLRGRIFEQEEEANDAVDEAVLAALARSPSRGDFDLIRGLVGLGVYALERHPRPAANRCLERVVEHLARRAERGAEGAAWRTSPDEMHDAAQRSAFPDGSYNLGVAHGAAGIVALLAGACRAGVAANVARPLLEEAMRWLLARELPDDEGYGYPHFYAPSVTPQKCRVAWCYGDLGMAAAMTAAARAVERPDWERAALALALRAAERSFAESGVVDAGLCHGAAGVAHLFNRLYQASGEPRLAEAARRWFVKTLEMREPGQGAGGYRALYTHAETRERTWIEDSGFLSGSAGIGLALLAAVSAVEPDWDRLLLLSLQPG